MAGFRSPAFWLGIGAAAAVTQAGFKTPLPVFPAGAISGPTQAGFISPHPVLLAGVGLPPPVEITTDENLGGRRNPNAWIYKDNIDVTRLMREDEDLIGVIVACINNGIIK